MRSPSFKNIKANNTQSPSKLEPLETHSNMSYMKDFKIKVNPFTSKQNNSPPSKIKSQPKQQVEKEKGNKNKKEKIVKLKQQLEVFIKEKEIDM